MPRRPAIQPPDPGLLILASLSSGPKHGYAITQDVRAFAGVALGPGTLYGAIARLEERGLIEAVESVDRRRPYRLTGAGRQSLEGQLSVLGRLTSTALGRLAIA
jgi:DNA-binding PadR family transcriptional regulator